jgi:hypothetical protein
LTAYKTEPQLGQGRGSAIGLGGPKMGFSLVFQKTSYIATQKFNEYATITP